MPRSRTFDPGKAGCALGEAIAERTIELLEQTGALRSGHFVLSSGLHSDRYCQCAALFERPEFSAEVAGLMRARLGEVGVDASAIDVVLSPALGGILWGYELARALGVRTMFAERKAGERFALRRGFAITSGERVLLAEDVVTTGGSVMELVPVVESAGGEVAAIASVVDRSRGAFDPGVPFAALAALAFETYGSDGVPAALAAIPVEKPGSRAQAKEEAGR